MVTKHILNVVFFASVIFTCAMGKILNAVNIF